MSIKMGLAERDITPIGSKELVGFNRRNNTSIGIRDSLLTQVMIWESDDNLSVIVTIDSLGFTTEDSLVLRQKIAETLHIKEGAVMICFSHTHAAPNCGMDRDYFRFLCLNVVTAVEAARNRLGEVKVAWGSVEADIGINRRKEVCKLDRRIGILKVIDATTDKLMAILLRVTAHANVLTRENLKISADYIGETRNRLTKIYKCPVMITQGAAGNVKAKYENVRNGITKMAMEIEKAMTSIMEQLYPQKVERMSIFTEVLECHSAVPTLEHAMLIADEAMKECNICGDQWLAEVKRLQKTKIMQQKSKIEIQYFVINDGCICGIPDEVMCELAVDIEERSLNKRIFFGGYTNGCSGYLPTAEEFHKGGYEVLWSYLLYFKYHNRVMPLNVETAEQLTSCVIETWNKYNRMSIAQKLNKE